MGARAPCFRLPVMTPHIHALKGEHTGTKGEFDIWCQSFVLRGGNGSASHL